MSEIKISEEALLCSHREESHSHPHGYHVQILLNQRDAELAELRETLAAELEALTKEVERLKQLHTTDMRVTNESEDFHMKRCDQLRTQNRELREASNVALETLRHLVSFLHSKNEITVDGRIAINTLKHALAQTEVKHE